MPKLGSFLFRIFHCMSDLTNGRSGKPAALSIEMAPLSQCFSDRRCVESLGKLPLEGCRQDIVNVSAVLRVFLGTLRLRRFLVRHLLAEANAVARASPLHLAVIIGADRFEATSTMEGQEVPHLHDGRLGIAGAHAATLIQPRLVAGDGSPRRFAFRPTGYAQAAGVFTGECNQGKAARGAENLTRRALRHMSLQELLHETLGGLNDLVPLQYQALQKSDAGGALARQCSRVEFIRKLIRGGGPVKILKAAHAFAGVSHHGNDPDFLTSMDLPVDRHHMICEASLTRRQKNQSPLHGGPHPSLFCHPHFPLTVPQHVCDSSDLFRRDLTQLIETQKAVTV